MEAVSDLSAARRSREALVSLVRDGAKVGPAPMSEWQSCESGREWAVPKVLGGMLTDMV